MLASGIGVQPDDLARGIDARGVGGGCRGNVEGGVHAAAQEEAVVAANGGVRPDDLARGVDAECLGARKGEGIVERGVRIDWHDTDSSLTVSVTESVDRKAEPGSNLLALDRIRRASPNATRMTRIAVVAWTRRP